MAINSTDSSIAPASKNRARTITIFMGDYDYVDAALVVLQPPYIVAEYCGCEPILDGSSDPVPDSLGLDGMKDTPGWRNLLTITDPSAILAMVAGVITPLETALDAAATAKPIVIYYKEPL